MDRAISSACAEKQWEALTSVMAVLLLTGTKLTAGVTSGSLGVLSGAAHSGLDLLAAAMTYLAVRISGREADAGHTYGHGKIENLSALCETILLPATCAWIVYEAGERLLGAKQAHVDAGLWTFLVIILSPTMLKRRRRQFSRTSISWSISSRERH